LEEGGARRRKNEKRPVRRRHPPDGPFACPWFSGSCPTGLERIGLAPAGVGRIRQNTVLGKPRTGSDSGFKMGQRRRKFSFRRINRNDPPVSSPFSSKIIENCHEGNFAVPGLPGFSGPEAPGDWTKPGLTWDDRLQCSGR
jgi:hypothetical protein